MGGATLATPRRVFPEHLITSLDVRWSASPNTTAMPPTPPAQLAATTARAYRELLKVQRTLFRGDAPARAAALIETRNQFMRHANAAPSETPDLIQDAYNTAGFLHENVAQTVLSPESGNYGACHPRLTSRLVTH